LREDAARGPAMTATGDPALIERAKDGDLGAFELLYRRNVGRVYAVCLRLLADEGRAEELTQDAFVRAWQRLGSFEGRSAFSSWIHRVAVNLVIDALRARIARTAFEISVDEATAAREAAAPADVCAAIDLDRAIASLPAGARAVYVLHEIEGYRHEDIAELIGVEPGTSKAQLHRARALLRRALSR
jgi:RNA polymerase sigma-70 factor (ECF subfamily)